ncbi:MAG: KpsF/GutQ family sugar-phosphate isomerase [Methylophilaceae bacterium]|jgi:arabinose-5-phosphate isomerase|nr:KpsF/GutQ family sugar-phosphate isomerase [Methylophilaceae bacterium]
MSTELLKIEQQPSVSTRESLTLARKVLLTEAKEIEALASNLDASFDAAVALILHCKGRVVVSGMGKSGHVSRKIAATLASTGTPAFFMHPAEASHGDLGMITSGDVVIILSNSGESDEILNVLPTIKRLGAKVIAITGKKTSTLAKQSDIHLNAEVSQEACPLGLSPTASTTVALALGDALAVCVLDCRDFSAEDFAKSHPGGRLGRRLITRVNDVMRTGDAIPSVIESSLLSDALLEMTQKSLGFTAIINQDQTLKGIFTDGDLRRVFDSGKNTQSTKVINVMHANPTTINAQKLAAEAVELMEHHKINGLLVTDENNKLVGAFNMHDLLLAKII